MYTCTYLIYICVSEIRSYHWFRKWLVACSTQRPYLHQCCHIVNLTLRNKFRWKNAHATKCICRLHNVSHLSRSIWDNQCGITLIWHWGPVTHIYVSELGPVSISEKTSFRRISWSLEAARFVFRSVRSLWNLTGTSAALLPMCLSNFKAIRQFKVLFSRLRDFARSYEKTSFRILRRGTGSPLDQMIACPLFNAKPSSEPIMNYCQLDLLG